MKLTDTHLPHKVSDEGDVSVALGGAALDILHDGQHTSSAQKVHHAIQQHFPQLQLWKETTSSPHPALAAHQPHLSIQEPTLTTYK